ncbi:MAG: sigma-70 family RNA polymerase sigma factor [Gemmatimonadota bacterium]|nr:sigma-70 family RNA polymerase sigma factor [Gemmatimonadota bacterium]
MAARVEPETIGASRRDVIELIRRAQAGDDEAFGALYREHVGRVHALCLRLASDRARADDLTQDVFVRAWQALGTFRGDSAFSSWLHRLAVNLALNEQRARGRRLLRVLSEGAGNEFDAAAWQSVPGADIDLERAIASLPKGARTVFVLHDIEGYQHDEIARLTGTAVGTSKAHLFRARRLLREALER